MVRPAGLEPATLGLEGRCSIQMSYGRIACSKKIGRGGEIRTPDILLPKQARYQTALRPDMLACIIYLKSCFASRFLLHFVAVKH